MIGYGSSFHKFWSFFFELFWITPPPPPPRWRRLMRCGVSGVRWRWLAVAACVVALISVEAVPAAASDSPAAVTGVSARTGENPGELVVSWDAHPGQPQDAYRVAIAPVGGSYVGGEFGGKLGGPTRNAFTKATTITVAGLVPGGEYKVMVRARFKGSANSEWSAEATGFAGSAQQNKSPGAGNERSDWTAAQLAPSGLTAEAAPGQVVLHWNAPAGDAASVDGYRVLRRRTNSGEREMSVLVDDTGSTDTTYVDHTADEDGVVYAFRIVALRGDEASQRSKYATATGQAGNGESNKKGPDTDNDLLRNVPPSQASILVDGTWYRNSTSPLWITFNNTDLVSGTEYMLEATVTADDGTPLRPSTAEYSLRARIYELNPLAQIGNVSNTAGFGRGLRSTFTVPNDIDRFRLQFSFNNFGHVPKTFGVWVRIWEYAEPVDDCGSEIATACAISGHQAEGTFEVSGDVDWWGPIQLPSLSSSRITLEPAGRMPIEVAVTGVYNTRGQLLRANGDVNDNPPSKWLHRAASSRATGVDGAVTYIFDPGGTVTQNYYIGVAGDGSATDSGKGDAVGPYLLRIFDIPPGALAYDDYLPGLRVNGTWDTGITLNVGLEFVWKDAVTETERDVGVWYEGVIEDDGDCDFRTGNPIYRAPDIDYFYYELEAQTTYRVEMNGITLRDPQLRNVYTVADPNVIYHTFPGDPAVNSDGTFDSRHEFTTPSGSGTAGFIVEASAKECAAINNGNSGRYRIRVTEVP